MNAPDIPQPWADLIEGLTLLAAHAADDASPTWCEHDTLHVCAELSEFTGEQIEHLENLGFSPDYAEGGFYSVRFGSA